MKTNTKTFKQLLNAARERLAYHVEGVILEFTEEIVARMEAENVSKAQLAQRLETSPAYITKVLRGSSNFTLETMVKIARALNTEVRVHLQPVGSKTQWIDNREAVEEAAEKQSEAPDWKGVLTCFAISANPKTTEKPTATNKRVQAAVRIRSQANEPVKVEAPNEELALAA